MAEDLGTPDSECLLTEFDQHSLDYRNRWREICDVNLAHCPVARTSAGGGYWVVSGYAPLREAAHDYLTFSSRWDMGSIRKGPAGISIPPGFYPKIPAELDPPEFFPYRRLIGQSLSPERCGRWEPYIRQAVASCLARARDQGGLDLVLDLAAPLSTGVVMQALGLPVTDCAQLAQALHAIEFAKPGTPDFEDAATVLASWAEIITSLISARRREPADDLISQLANCMIDGTPMPVDHIVGICYLLLGSVDITTGFISNTLRWLHEFPDRRRVLTENPSLIPAAIEEFLRYFPPIHGLARTATRDAELNGQHIRAGDRVWLHFAAANRDRSIFAEPDDVRFDRAPNRHAAFGFGIHHCVGAPLARLEARVIVEMVLAHIPEYAIDDLNTPRYADIGKFSGFEKMPATIPRA